VICWGNHAAEMDVFLSNEPKKVFGLNRRSEGQTRDPNMSAGDSSLFKLTWYLELKIIIFFCL